MGHTFGSRSSDEPLLRTSVVIAGAIKSGKTSVAKLVAERLKVPHASFGDEVRRRAAMEGMNKNERRVLQDLGERIVHEQPDEFADAVIASVRPERLPGQPIILDGLRHLHVLRMLRELLSDTGVTLVYLDATFESRETRARSHSISADALATADGHQSEFQSGMLREAADLVFSAGTDIKVLADQIITRVRTF